MSDAILHNIVPSVSDEQYQLHILQDVSRTFALTIPQLPNRLKRAVSNAYLLCRIVDTIEDDNALDAVQTRHFVAMFSRIVAGELPAQQFADELSPLLSTDTISSEHNLIKNTATVLRITHSLNSNQREALRHCVEIMSKGMADYQDTETLDGLENMAAMDKYCYYVAGVVGEMLTKLFCDYSAEINRHQEVMMQLASSFGQGLQMTNILKDIWEDRKRGACWLPQDIFDQYGFDLRQLEPNCKDPNFHSGLGHLIGIARQHLQNALDYTLMIPKNEKGIRKFCLWALGMAVLTLDKLNHQRDFSNGSQVKISRKSVKITIAMTNMLVGQDKMLRRLFGYSARNLPVNNIRERGPERVYAKD